MTETAHLPMSVIVDCCRAYWSYQAESPTKTDFWYELLFMEEYGFDQSLVLGHAHNTPRWIQQEADPCWASPVSGIVALGEERIREFDLVLRDVLRAELGMPPLTEVEKLAWNYTPPNFKRYQYEAEGLAARDLTKAPKVDDATINLISQNVLNDKEAIRYATMISEYHRSFKFDPHIVNEEEKKVITSKWCLRYLEDKCCDIVGSHGNFTSRMRVSALIQKLKL